MNTDGFFDTKATYSSRENVSGQLGARVQYLDNVAKIGNRTINNTQKECFREVSAIPAPHFKDQKSKRDISVGEAEETIANGIEFRSDRKLRGRWQERYSYLYNGNLVAARKIRDDSALTHEVLTAYKIKPAFKRDFLNNLEHLKSEMLDVGAYRFDVRIMDMSMVMGQVLSDQLSLDDALFWQLGDKPHHPDGMRQYSMHLVVDNIGKITLEQLKVLAKWGLDIADSVIVKKFQNGERNIISYIMSRFSGNAHEWSREIC
tara:strand:+ start:2622 stop:3404 length:783 start_codon:yes stop_codon:yes gene_type:complete